MSFSPTWPRAGMTRSGTAFPLRPLAPLTKETGSGSWPTPRVAAERTGKASLLAKHWSAPSLAQVVELSMGMLPREYDSWEQVPPGAMDVADRWPTPNAADGQGGRKTPDEDLLTGRRASGAKVQVSLRDAVRQRELWPTPSVKGNYNRAGLSAKSGDGLHTAVNRWPTPKASPSGPDYARAEREGSGGDDPATAVARENFKTPTSAPFSHGGSGGELHKQVAPSGGPLNPQWVAWLMGFPIDWTSLPPSETRSSRRSRNGSAGASSKAKP
jgi:hypothetical protein